MASLEDGVRLAVAEIERGDELTLEEFQTQAAERLKALKAAQR